ncbi:hypothetical protein KOI35_38250 [Actinoplanes bogorensis]|uniref:WD40 repeat protein n=1 Tax=Paractinoplanes bogorensis TaxID=1610840 RepID=A0ABS5Z103_9ACTN|nr:hypothetical protein [Actinoplanes bogorensis]MBU2669371.1 hypothetical protein [Actinoplanes bogorensis]
MRLLSKVAAAVLLLVTMPGTAAHAAGPVPGGRLLYLQFDGSTGDQGRLLSSKLDGSGLVDYQRAMSLYSYPDYSPDGRQIAYVESYEFHAMSAGGTGDRVLVGAPCGPAWPRWSPDGKWIAAESCGDIWKVSSRGYESGWADVTGAYDYNDLTVSWAPGSKRFAVGTYPGVQIFRADGSSQRTLTDLADAYRVAWNPDGVTLAVEAHNDLWLVDTVTGRARQVTDTPDVVEFAPLWSPDGRWLVYGRGPGEFNPDFPGYSTAPEIWMMNRTGKGQHDTGLDGVPTSWRKRA